MDTPTKNQNPCASPASVVRPALIDGLVFEFREAMSGYISVGETDPKKGLELGRNDNTQLRFDVQIRTDDLGRFLRLTDHTAKLTGTVTFEPLGGTFPIRDGIFNLFRVEEQQGMRQMVYAFRLTARDGQTYYLHGHKEIYEEPGTFDAVDDMTRLFTFVYRGEDEHAPIYGAGELFFELKNAPALVASMKVEGATSWRQKIAAYTAFTSFAYGVLRDEYLKDLRLFYDSQYENLVLAGELQTSSGVVVPFFFISGVHDKGFPWGDNEIFWDVLLAVGDGKGGYKRYCITDRVLEGLELDVSAGLYRYRGPLFYLPEGYATSFSQMRRKELPLVELDAEFEISFEAHAYDAVAVSFPLVPKLVRRLSSAMAKALRDALANKFKEYHCDRGIYYTTIEYLTAFPVDFGLVDGYVSADGPFGIFADPLPNETHMVLGGPDLVAVDWVGASKMGIDPMISEYMKLAVNAFGKPEIKVIGDRNPYRPWLNVPVTLSLFTNKGLDADYHFGNLMYSAAAQMDETHFHHKNKTLYMRILRRLTVPLRRTFFVRTGENPSLGNRFFSWLFYRMGF